MTISRRSFFRLMLGAVAAEAIPFNRVYSFPTKIVLATPSRLEFELDILEINGIRLPLEDVSWNTDLIIGRHERSVTRACTQYLDVEALRKDFGL